MDILQYLNGKTLSVVVKPNAQKNAILGYDKDRDALKVSIAAVPDKDKANKELVKFFSKEYKLNVRIIKGLKSRQKLLEIKH